MEGESGEQVCCEISL